MYINVKYILILYAAHASSLPSSPSSLDGVTGVGSGAAEEDDGEATPAPAEGSTEGAAEEDELGEILDPELEVEAKVVPRLPVAVTVCPVLMATSLTVRELPEAPVSLTSTLVESVPLESVKKLSLSLVTDVQVLPPSELTSKFETCSVASMTCIANQYCDTPSLFTSDRGLEIGQSI